MHKIYETLFSLTWRIVRFNTGDFRVLIPEKYESRIQLKESGIPLTIEIRNPSSTGKESEIQDLLIWTPEFSTMGGVQISQRGIQNPRLSWKYLTLGEKKSEIHSLLKVHLDFGVVCGTDLIWISVPTSSKRSDTSCYPLRPVFTVVVMSYLVNMSSVSRPDIVPRSPSDL